MLSRKYYKDIAGVLAKYPDCEMKRSLIKDFSILFLSDNPRFNPSYFEVACTNIEEDE